MSELRENLTDPLLAHAGPDVGVFIRDNVHPGPAAPDHPVRLQANTRHDGWIDRSLGASKHTQDTAMPSLVSYHLGLLHCTSSAAHVVVMLPSNSPPQRQLYPLCLVIYMVLEYGFGWN